VAAPGSPPLTGPGAPEAVLRRLQLAVHGRLDGLLQGDFRGLLPGHGSEPGETRAYVPGDDVRRIDWAVTARTASTHVREAIADRELEVTLVLDQSASLELGSARSTKRDLAVAGAAAIGLLTARQGNRIGAVVVGPQGLRRVPPRAGRPALLALLHDLVTAPAAEGGGSTDLEAALWGALRAARRRGLVAVVSDFLAPPGWERPLRALGARHDLVGIEVVDPLELALPAVGQLHLADPETGTALDVPTHDAALRARYAEAAAAQRAAIAAALRRAGATHVRLRTDRDWLVDLARAVEQRRHRGGVAPAPRP
jgi:uncharacterized protein (DUF58 family)